ncbi:MAG: zinc ribbon domain-containing protein [Sporomusaceae bacterium]|nr:zinc ribbon domain-containing protein [Sporomusaceae bacterium]
MVEPYNFVRNYDDFSSERGYQFEFYCDRCGTTFRIEFQSPFRDDLLFGTDNGGSGVRFSPDPDPLTPVRASAHWRQAHERAFHRAIVEARSDFIQCPRCCRWVCRKNCWNNQKSLCKDCSPDFGIDTLPATGFSEPSEEWQQPLPSPSAAGKLFTSCPNCEALLPASVKFCPDCGTKIQLTSHCSECGAPLGQNHQYCLDCGAKRK